jgi:hypothetical protein
MNERMVFAAVCGFGLRITPLPGALRVRCSATALELELREHDAWRGVKLDNAEREGSRPLHELASKLANVAEVEGGPSESTWRIETALCRIPLPLGWTLSVDAAADAPALLELLGPQCASMAVRSARRMPALESFQGPGHRFRDIGQLERAGWIELEHHDDSGAWLYRHEQFHRGTTPFVVTLKALLDRADAHLAALASVVEGLELTEGS